MHELVAYLTHPYPHPKQRFIAIAAWPLPMRMLLRVYGPESARSICEIKKMALEPPASPAAPASEAPPKLDEGGRVVA